MVESMQARTATPTGAVLESAPSQAKAVSGSAPVEPPMSWRLFGEQNCSDDDCLSASDLQHETWCRLGNRLCCRRAK